MRRKLTVLRTAIMVVIAITVCSGKDAKTTTAVKVVTRADTTAGMMDGGTEDIGVASGLGTVAESQSSESASQEVALLEGVEDMSYAGAELGQSETKPFTEKMQKAVADKDAKALVNLYIYPVYVSLEEGQGEEIADESALLKMDAGQIFTESLLKEIAGTDVDMLEQFGAGVITGEGNSVIFNNVDRQAAITGINLNQSMFEHAMSGHAVKKSKISH